jgi:hypothetical protein
MIGNFWHLGLYESLKDRVLLAHADDILLHRLAASFFHYALKQIFHSSPIPCSHTTLLLLLFGEEFLGEVSRNDDQGEEETDRLKRKPVVQEEAAEETGPKLVHTLEPVSHVERARVILEVIDERVLEDHEYGVHEADQLVLLRVLGNDHNEVSDEGCCVADQSSQLGQAEVASVEGGRLIKDRPQLGLLSLN